MHIYLRRQALDTLMHGGKLLPFIVIFLSAFLIFCSSRADALTLLNAGYNMSSVSQAYYGLTIASMGGTSIDECDCAWYDWWCMLTCHPIYIETNCFGNNFHAYYLSSYNGSSGIGYFNNTCEVPTAYQSLGIYAHSPISPYSTVITTPSSRTTVFAQVKYNVNNWTGVNTSVGKYPVFAMFEPSNLSFYPAIANLTLAAGIWQVTTIWHTFDASSNISVALLINEIDNMTAGWNISIDYLRVGFVDMDKYVTSAPSAGMTAADCAWSAGGAGCGWSGNLNGTYVYNNNPNATVYVDISGHSLGEDPSVPCETIYTNWSDVSYFSGKYSARMADEMPPFSNSIDIGSDVWNDPNGWLGYSSSWCNIIFKDFVFHNDYEYYYHVAPSYTMLEQSIGMIDFVNSTYARPSWFYLQDSCTGLCPAYLPSHAPCTGSLQFNDSGIIKGISECNVVYPSLGYFRYPINLSANNITAPNSWMVNGFAVYWSHDGLTTPWIPMAYFTTMFNATCEEGWYCDGTEEYWMNSACVKYFETNCSGICGCSGSRCFETTGYWNCGSNMTSYHYNSTCHNDLQLLCDQYCDYDTGMCFNETICASDIDCFPFCDGSTRYYNPYCTPSYTCDWYNLEVCGYGCTPSGCSGAPPSPPLFGNGTDITTLRPADVISSIYYGVLGFVNAMGGSFMFFIFLMIVIVVIILCITLVPKILEEYL